jgi:hypothetical protein
MTFMEAALEILKRERRPLHYKEIAEKATERKLLTFVGRTPEVTMQTQLTAAVKKAPGQPFVRVKPGVFGLLRYPEAAPEPEPVVSAPVASPKAQKGEGKSEKAEGKSEKGEGKSEKSEGKSEKSAAGEEARGGRRRRRGGRGRRRGRGGAEGTEAAETTEAPEAKGASPEPTGEEDHPSHEEHDDSPEEPEIGSLSAEARAAALAESGVLEGGRDEKEGEEEEVAVGEPGDDEEGVEAEDEDDEDGKAEDQGEGERFTPSPVVSEAPAAAKPGEGSAPAAPASSEGQGQPARKITSPIDAAIEILKGQAPGRGLHVRQIADAAVRRRLIHGEPNEAWRVMRAALAAEGKERLRAAQRPRVRPAGSGLYALTRRPPDTDLERAEFVLGEARRALRERTMAALEQRLAELAPPAFEAVVRVLLQREGYGPATFIKRVEGTIYLEALRGRGLRPSRCLIALRPGTASAGRRAVGELRAGIRARNQDEGLLLMAGRLADDAVSEWKQSGAPVEVVDGPALAESCVRHGVGVISASVNVEFVDADFFAEISEG